jgi:hypothetical protein
MNMIKPPGTELARYTQALLGVHATRLRAAWAQKDRGASAVELAVITAVLVGLAVVILGVIIHFAHTEDNQITQTQVPNPNGNN